MIQSNSSLCVIESNVLKTKLIHNVILLNFNETIINYIITKMLYKLMYACSKHSYLKY